MVESEITYTYGAMIALAGRNEGLALDNQPSNFEFRSRAKFSVKNKTTTKGLLKHSKTPVLLHVYFETELHLPQSFLTIRGIPAS